MVPIFLFVIPASGIGAAPATTEPALMQRGAQNIKSAENDTPPRSNQKAVLALGTPQAEGYASATLPDRKSEVYR